MKSSAVERVTVRPSRWRGSANCWTSHDETIERYGELLGRPVADLSWWKAYSRFCIEALRSSR